ncbi:MAG TPA: SRPBCC domain-containing protein [Solirubrobacteraceae bacterium]
MSREIELPLDAGEAWEAVTELEGWLVDDADLLLEPGEEGTLRLPDGEERRAVVEEVEPRERLTFWWWTEESPATHVELTLVPAVSGTVVRVVESGWAGTPFSLAYAVPAGPPIAFAPGEPGFGASRALPVGRIEIRESKVLAALDRLGLAPV